VKQAASRLAGGDASLAGPPLLSRHRSRRGAQRGTHGRDHFGAQPAYALPRGGVRQAGPGGLEHHAVDAGLTMQMLYNLLWRSEIHAPVAHEIIRQLFLQCGFLVGGQLFSGI